MKNGSNKFKSGFISITGAPNVGKSTLLNRILGKKISITSRKAQTTRNRILGVLHRKSSQFVFLDTPGIHRAKSELNARMVEAAVSSIGDVDLALVMVDSVKPDPESENIVINSLMKKNIPAILATNKIDLAEKAELISIIDKWSGLYPFQAIVPISARTGEGVDVLLAEMENLLPDGPPYYPEDTITDVPERFIAAEIIREKVLRFTGQEIPYSTAVTIESFKEDEKKGLISIHAVIHLERKSQKGIVIGKNGAKLKEIGTEARKDIERMVGVKVFLKLFVRIQKNWTRDTKALRKFGY